MYKVEPIRTNSKNAIKCTLEPMVLNVVFERKDQYAGISALWNGSTITISANTETNTPETAMGRIGDIFAFANICEAYKYRSTIDITKTNPY